MTGLAGLPRVHGPVRSSRAFHRSLAHRTRLLRNAKETAAETERLEHRGDFFPPQSTASGARMHRWVRRHSPDLDGSIPGPAHCAQRDDAAVQFT